MDFEKTIEFIRGMQADAAVQMQSIGEAQKHMEANLAGHQREMEKTNHTLLRNTVRAFIDSMGRQGNGREPVN